jgi:hypothetical protein
MAVAKCRKVRPIGAGKVAIGWGDERIRWTAASKTFDSLPK